jgi:hypothetical protein
MMRIIEIMERMSIVLGALLGITIVLLVVMEIIDRRGRK